MKICIVTYEFPPEVTSGFSRTAYNLADYTVRKGHNVTVVTASSKEKIKFPKKDLKVVYLPKNKYFSKNIKRILFVRKLRKYFNNYPDDFDIIHFMEGYESYCIDSIDPKKSKIIISVNDYYYSFKYLFNYPCSFSEKILRFFYIFYLMYMNSRYLPKVDFIAFDAQYSLKTFYNKQYIHKSRLIYKGIDSKLFRPAKKKNKYTSQRILFVGNNLKRKGLIYLVKAMNKLKKKYPKMKLVVVTKMHDRSIMKFIKQHNINVQFVRKCTLEQLIKFYQEANVFVLPSVLEAIAQTFYEALSTGTPVITTDVDANKELINKDVGLLVKPKDVNSLFQAIDYLFSNPLKAKRMGANGRNLIKQRFTQEIMSEKYLKLYKEC